MTRYDLKGTKIEVSAQFACVSVQPQTEAMRPWSGFPALAVDASTLNEAELKAWEEKVLARKQR